MNPAEFSPQYVDAVAAARWSYWLFPLFLLAPFLAMLCRWHRLNIWLTLVVMMMATVGIWFSLWCYSEGIWTAMENNATTAAEMDEVTSDTGRVLGPFLVGAPFSMVYSFASYLIVWSGHWLASRVRSHERVRMAG